MTKYLLKMGNTQSIQNCIPSATIKKLSTQISFAWLKNIDNDTIYKVGYIFNKTEEDKCLFGVDRDGCLHRIFERTKIIMSDGELYLSDVDVDFVYGYEYRPKYIVYVNKNVNE